MVEVVADIPVMYSFQKIHLHNKTSKKEKRTGGLDSDSRDAMRLEPYSSPTPSRPVVFIRSRSTYIFK